MAHFARLNKTNEVISVHVLNNDVVIDSDGNEQEHEGIRLLTNLYGGWWKQTSYNHNFRKNYAGVGYQYDAERDAFIPPQPFPSWSLNEDDCLWVPPTPMPMINQDEDTPEGKRHKWNETTTSWDVVTD